MTTIVAAAVYHEWHIYSMAVAMGREWRTTRDEWSFGAGDDCDKCDNVDNGDCDDSGDDE